MDINSLKTLVDTNETQQNPSDRITGLEVRTVDKAIIDELALRGIPTIPGTGGLATLPNTETKLVFIVGEGFFYDSPTGPANGTTIFSGVGGRFWVKHTSGGGITLTDVQQDIIDIRAFGGVPDGTTDNQPALLAAKASAPIGALIWLKNRDTGVYHFNNTDVNLFNNCTLYVEEGVTISIAIENTQFLNTVTPTKIILESLNNQDMMYYPQDPNIESVDNQSLSENIVTRESINANSFVERGTPNWGTTVGDTLTSVPANLSVVGTNQINLTGISGNNMRVGVLDAIPGAAISACARGTSSWALMWVESSWGYAVSYGGFTVQIRKFGDPNNAIGNNQLGLNREIYGGPYGNYLNYGTDLAVCSIKLSEDGKSVEFLHNGINRANHHITLGGQPITKWGFGGYGAGGNVSWYDFIIEYNRKPSAIEPDTVQIFGDSQVGYFLGSSWIKYFEKYVNNTLGYRIGSIENYAVSGQTVQQQEAVFNGVTHKGVSIILAGTNNIQGQSSITSMITSLNNMLTALNYSSDISGATVGTIIPGNKRFIVCIPPMFFSYSLNGNKGKASSNYQFGGAYRMAILRWAAENNVMVVDLMSEFGATTEYSKLMRDDIHLSDLGAAVAGKEIAKKYIALCSNVTPNKVVTGDTNNGLYFVKSASAPITPGTVAKWLSVYQGGVEYKLPVYQ